ncbi:(Fe-S)-binding protein [Salidesulfovibrio brasiliensis]|uniref:(Fe-S)-binding protein n=1 Tax=Salidesulfovibrio brasiliensis TaxID=221711 RepID=UPI0009FA3725|nr:(Fe-S)-binding protein [Salidesulfovibrio brasiliensis]
MKSIKLTDISNEIRSQCTDCGACVAGCAFLREHGTPAGIAASLEEASPHPEVAFECSLCGLCGVVCPEGLNPVGLFLAMREKAWAEGRIDRKRYEPIIRYEAAGTSRWFSSLHTPAGCDTVLFPGCTLPGTRPGTTTKLLRLLQNLVPSLGVMLDCCHKPSHDLGRREFFSKQFGAISHRLKERGIKRVLVACPNCFKVFRQYGEGLETVSVYEILADQGNEFEAASSMAVSLHDPCPLRHEPQIHEAVRVLASRNGLDVVKSKRKPSRTLCCGEGGTVAAVRPDLAGKWTERCSRQAGGNPIITYCAGCAGFLSQKSSAYHLLDAMFYPEEVRQGTFRPVRSPMTYLNRLILKRSLKKEFK